MPADVPEADPTWSVTELVGHIQQVLEHALPDEVWVEGELADLSRSPAGHVYFRLIEPGPLGAPPHATLPVALFDTKRRAVNALLRRSGGVRMTDGMQIRVRGRIDVYVPQGRVQLRMTGIDPMYTLGRLAAERDRVLAVLAAERLLDANAGVPTPAVPLRVGLVTASGSAAYADFVDELSRSGYAFRISHVDARVQGRDAERSIVRALQLLVARDVDVVALVRGGGARTDLASFDSEAVARAVARHPVPVHTGIGHETDLSVSDHVAHTAHKTPTACAAALVAEVASFLTRLDRAGADLVGTSTRALEMTDRALAERGRGLAGLAQQTIDESVESMEIMQRSIAAIGGRAWRAGARRLTSTSTAIRRAGTRQLHQAETAVGDRSAAVPVAVDRSLTRAGDRLAARASTIRALDPARSLARGWSITRRPDGQLVRSIGELEAGDRLITTVLDGEAHTVVETTETFPESPSA